MSTKIQKKADALLNQFGIPCAPVPVEYIATELGAKVIFKPYRGKEKISGVLIRESKRTLIGINSETSPTRQRFSIAHELGHMLLHKGEIFVDVTAKLNIAAEVNMRQSTPSMALDKKEIEANQFAAELLMPVRFINDQLTEILDQNPDIDIEILTKDLSTKFEVSQHSMEYRLKQLGLLVGLED